MKPQHASFTPLKKKTPWPARKTRGLPLALSLLAAAACAQGGPSGALESNSAVAAQAIPSVQIRSISQNPSERVPPRVIVLPELANTQLPASELGQPQQIGVGRALPDAATAAAMADLLTWTQAADGSQRAALSVRAPGAVGLRLGLLVEQLPPGALLRVYAPDTAKTTEIAATEVLRIIQVNLDSGDNSAAAHTYWLPTVQGIETALEIELPAGVSPAQLKVSLPLVSQMLIR